MKVAIFSEGYGDKEAEKLTDYDEVIILEKDKVTSEEFHQIVIFHLEDELFISSVASIGLQLIQLLPSFKTLVKQGKIIHFLKKGDADYLSDEKFFHIVYHLALDEEQSIKRRTVYSMNKARENGSTIGRPKIEQELVKKINELYTIDKKTIREIAMICEVSIGTAFKYAK